MHKAEFLETTLFGWTKILCIQNAIIRLIVIFIISEGKSGRFQQVGTFFISAPNGFSLRIFIS